MKPEPMSVDDMRSIVNATTYEGVLDTCRAIITVRDKQWQELLEKREKMFRHFQVGGQCGSSNSVAAQVEVRRADTHWARYQLCASVAYAEEVKSQLDGGDIEVRVVPLYTTGAKGRE
jgi:hypothetical protein